LKRTLAEGQDSLTLCFVCPRGYPLFCAPGLVERRKDLRDWKAHFYDEVAAASG